VVILPENYQIWFVKRIFDALHDFGSGIDRTAEVEAALRGGSQFHPDRERRRRRWTGRWLEHTYNQVVQAIYREEMRRSREEAQAIARGERPRGPLDEFATWEELEAAHRENESAACRCVGVVVETRPDHISADEVLRVRRLGATKVQIGFQSLSDEVLRLNRRGHTVEATRGRCGCCGWPGSRFTPTGCPTCTARRRRPTLPITGDVHRSGLPARCAQDLSLLVDRQRGTDAILRGWTLAPVHAR